MDKPYATKEEAIAEAEKILGKTINDFIPSAVLPSVTKKLSVDGANRKGHLGDLVEKYLFGIENNSRPEPDLMPVGIEVKTNPLKSHAKRGYISKERLVFSMIDYTAVANEVWDKSSFLKKNKLLLLLFYLFEIDKTILDYKFKFIHFLDLLNDVSEQDIEQIKKDWEFIVTKIKKGEAHLLSEGDTYYLGACTKAKDSNARTHQPNSSILAKPRAFSLKQTYLNYIIQEKLLGKKARAVSIYETGKAIGTIEEVVKNKFSGFIGKTDRDIKAMIGWKGMKNPKNYKRLLANWILSGKGSNEIEELEKANVTLKVVTLEHTGTLKESLSFPAFDYKDLVTQEWDDDKSEKIADFHAILETKRFLFVVFRKIKGSKDIKLEEVKFWNFPMKDIAEAKRVFDLTVKCIKDGRYNDLPKMKDSPIAHVRPHGRDSKDTAETPQGTKEIKRCFWLNAKYIQKAIE